MDSLFDGIPGSKDWKTVELIEKGWSSDKKYYIKTKKNEEMLLRLSDIEQYENKRKEFEHLKLLRSCDIIVSRPIHFGICNQGKKTFSLLTWIDGNDAMDKLPTLSEKEQYSVGIQAGEILREMHSIPAPADQIDWEERFNRKIDRNIKNCKACNIHLERSTEIIDFVESNRIFLKNRPQTFQHGDYHIGNMIITSDRNVGVIDFNRFDYGDPWEEFNRITWSASISPKFASGCINGYFDNQVPDLFFRLMALYIASNQLATIPWAMPFGQKEIDTMITQNKYVLEWYDDFRIYVPKWYLSNPDEESSIPREDTPRY